MSAPLASGTVISYPIPAYQNLPIHAEYYIPSRFVISAITLGQLTIVETIENINYVVGQQVRLIIPANFGSYQLNGVTAIVIRVPTVTSVTLELDTSTNVDAFISSTGIEQAQIVAIGDIRSGIRNGEGPINQAVFIPGSFRNISPE